MRKNFGSKITVLTLSTLLLGSCLFPFEAKAVTLSSIDRLAGPTRNQTAIEIALKLNPGIAPAVVLASPKSFSDALAGIPLAIQKGAPILWVGNTPEQSKDVLDYVKEHCDKKGTVYLFGGEGAIPKSFERELQAMGYKSEQIQRLGGNNRYETAVQIAQKVELKGNPIYITTGENYSQAASAAVLAAAQNSPVLLLPSKGNVPESIIKYLNQIAAEQSFSLKIIGNNTVIPESMLEQLKSKVNGLDSSKIERLSGDDIYDLMAKANGEAWVNKQEASKEAIDYILLASGQTYVDSIPGAMLSARVGAPLIFINEKMPESSAKILADIFNFNRQKDIPYKKVTALGGTGVISSQAIAEADSLYSLGESLKNQAQVWTYAELNPFSEPAFGVKGKGNLIVLTDSQSHTVQVINNDKKVSTLVGVTNAFDEYRLPVGGFIDGSAKEAKFNEPKGIALDDKGTLYVADSANGAIRTVDSQGNVKTLVRGLNKPTGIVLGLQGEVYVTETLNHRILKIDSQGQMTVLAGGGYATKDGELIGAYADGKGEQAKFNEPQGLAIDNEGNLYVADTGNQRIRKVSPDGVVTTLAGSGTALIENTTYIEGGYTDGEATTAQFNFPMGLTVDKNKNVYLADSLNHCIRVITPAGKVSTLAGALVAGKRDGAASLAQFNIPSDVFFGDDGSLFIVDQGNALLRQYFPEFK